MIATSGSRKSENLTTALHWKYSIVISIALTLCITTHKVFYALDHEHVAPDTASYMIPADNLLHKHMFADTLRQPETDRTPGYPLVLIIFLATHIRLECLIIIQHILCVLLVVAATGIIFSMTESISAALVVAFILSLDIPTLLCANLLLTETLFTVNIAMTSYALYIAVTKHEQSRFAWILTGVIGGISVLIRPIAFLYCAALAAYVWLTLRKRFIGPVVLTVISFLLPSVIWATRNYVAVGYWGVSTVGATDLLYYRAAGALAVQQPGNYYKNIFMVRSALIQETCTNLELIFKQGCTQITKTDKSSYMIVKGLHIILMNPWGYLRSMLYALSYVLFGGGAETLSRLAHIDPHIAKYLLLLVTIPEVCLAIAGIGYWRRRDRKLCYVLVATIAYFLLISLGAEAYSRFRVPVMPQYALLIGGGVVRIIQFVHRACGNNNRIIKTEQL
ncbi:MAG: hypothetical protein FWD64_00120 [Acidobacteriaceae bacterium]|nr:hypothetical protein [Acidobacteriaceae bacterium]